MRVSVLNKTIIISCVVPTIIKIDSDERLADVVVSVDNGIGFFVLFVFKLAMFYYSCVIFVSILLILLLPTML